MTEPTIDQNGATPLSKNEIIQQIAKTLTDRRAARSLTLEKVTQSIKIRLPYLQAIEKGEWDQLPGEVYVRGFIRRYAQYLGIDGDKLIAPYVKISESPVENSFQSSPSRSGELSRMNWLWVVLGGILLIGFIKLVMHDRTAPVATDTVVKTGKSSKSEPETKTEIPKDVEPKANLEKHSLELYSPYPLWLRVSASEKSFEGFIPQGATWTWKGEGEFTVRLGHTKEVKMSFDGKEVTLTEDQKKITLPS